MKCIYCGHPESKVIDSRPLNEGDTIRRRRECQKCARRFMTYEKAEQIRFENKYCRKDIGKKALLVSAE